MRRRISNFRESEWRQICRGCSVLDTPNNPLRGGVAVYTFRPLGASVAQLDRASDYGSDGSRFNSWRMRHTKSRNLSMGGCSIMGTWLRLWLRSRSEIQCSV